VAEPRLIAAYLNELRYSVERLPDRDDIVSEAEDHLLSSVEAAVASGASPADAEAEALARFGSATLVARVFAEEAKRGGAVSKRLTRRAGLAAMVAPPLMAAGAFTAGLGGGSKQPYSGMGVAMTLAAIAGFVYALVGLRARHGGLGPLGRIAFWLAILAIPIAMPFGYTGIIVLAVELGVVVALYGIAMLRAAILPRLPVALFAFTWPAWAPTAWLITAAGGDANLYAILPILVTLGSFAWLGWAMWREPALDVRTPSGAGPLAAA
jgi:hypothetical protein